MTHLDPKKPPADYPNDAFHNPAVNTLRKCPQAVEHDCGFFPSRQNSRLFYRIWTPFNGSPNELDTIIVHIHGMTAHSEPAIVVADHILSEKQALFAFDLSGHGRSEGERGNISRFMQFIEDLEDAVTFIGQRYPSRRLILSAESMGALVAMHYMLRNKHKDHLSFEKLLLWSPAFRPNLTEGWAKDWQYMLNVGMGLVFQRSNPTINVDHSKTFSDPNALTYHNADPAVLKKISAQYLLKISTAMDRLWQNAEQIPKDLPTYIFHAQHDFLVNQRASFDFYQKYLNTPLNRYNLVNKSWHALFYDRYFSKQHWASARLFIQGTNISE